MTALEKADLITKFADDMKAERLERLEVGEKTSIADFFIVCSGTSDRHVTSMRLARARRS